MSTDHDRIAVAGLDPAALLQTNEELRREIAIRCRVEEALRADVERFRMMLAGVKDYAIVMLDPGGYFVSWNDGAEQITGHKAEEIIGRHFSCLYRPADVETGKPAAALQVAGSEGRIADDGWRLRKDGSTYWASVVLTALRDERGVLRGFAKVLRDITARKRIEEMLELQARVIEKMAESVMVVDDTGHILTTNPATERMFGYEPGELIGCHVFMLRAAEEAVARDAVEKILASIEGGSSWFGEVERKRKDGSRLVTRTQISAFEVDGKRHYFDIQEDITAPRQVEESLRQSEEQFTKTFQTSAIGMALVGLDGGWLKVNPALCELVGYTEADLLVRRFQDITHPDDLETDLAHVRQLTSGEISSYQMEKRYLHARGHIIKTLLNVSIVRDAQGRPLYFVSQIQDITERKRAEEELRWKTAFLEAQVNCSSDGILVVDKDVRKILQNQRMNDLWKIPPEIANDPDDRSQVQWVTKQVKNPEPFLARVVHLFARPYEISREEIELTDGTILDRYTAPVVGKDGTYYGRIWTFRDVTTRKRLEAQLFQSQKMETVGRLAGGVAHEFNSILTVILGQSEFLLAELPEPSPMRADVRDIIRATERAAGLTQQLLAYSRQQFLRLEKMDLNRVLAGMESTFRLVLGGAAEVRIRPGAALRLVTVDAGQIEQVILNLAVNARHAMPEGGCLTLETANVTLEDPAAVGLLEMKPGDYVVLTVTDTGVGMTDEVKNRLFEPFFSTKDVGQGSGLGLATCYGVVKQCGGYISVQSSPGQGTTFRIYLPPTP